MWQLKPTSPAFAVVDGPLAGRSFAHGQQYVEIPPGDAARFERINPPAPTRASKKEAAPVAEEDTAHAQ